MLLYVFDAFRIGAAASDDGTLVDVTDVLTAEVAPIDRMSALVEGWPTLAESVAEAIRRGESVRLDEVVLRPPQPRPGKVIAAPVNYRLHRDEMADMYRTATIATIETYLGFIKASSSIAGPSDHIEIPFADRRVDHEAEVGIVIGPRARRVRAEDALDHVFGYVPLLDITVRGDEDRSWRKSLDTFTPIGPAIVTADHVPDPGDIDFRLTVNGEVKQEANTRDLIYSIPRLVEVYSDGMTLESGDIIATGTPEGVGPIRPGDEIRLTIDGIGELTMPVRAREPATV